MSRIGGHMHYSKSASAISIPILAGLACLLCIPALVVHIRARNLPAITVVLGIVLANFFNFINALLWPTDDTSIWWQGYGLCDIEVKLYIGLDVAMNGAVACVFRQLATILNTEHTTLVPSPAQRRRRVAFEVILCIVVPTYLMIAHYIVQTQRYYIFTISGCIPTVALGWPSIVLIFIWPLLICLLAVIYCITAIYRLLKYRRQFNTIMSNSRSSVNKSRFIRLFAFSTILVLAFFPIETYTFVRNMSFPRPRYSWDKVHDWTEPIFKQSTGGTAIFTRWVQIGTGYMVFFFFGFGTEAIKMYRSWLFKLRLGVLIRGTSRTHLAKKAARKPTSGNTLLVTDIENGAPTIRSYSNVASTDPASPSRHLSVFPMETLSSTKSISPVTSTASKEHSRASPTFSPNAQPPSGMEGGPEYNLY